ncbi:hypothetical protein KSS87_002674 [Heliosperma pusillum]|nr:hypothetical protein KSS87_002674 [Heliosperma pusillum]
MSKKSRSCESNEDRLSGLPDELIVHILSFMPTLDAVRTMLIRRFRNLWTLVPALRFDFNEYYGRMIRIDDEPPHIYVAYSSCARFVRNALMLHSGPTLDTFHLSMDDFHEEFRGPKINGDVQMWLRFANDKEVKELYFRCVSCYLSPPRCVFTSQSLTTLTLSGCSIKHYEHQSQPHMVTLRKLSLICVNGTTKDFNQLISGCPFLQELVIDRALVGPGSYVLNINAPSVRNLYLCMLNCRCNLTCPSLKIMDFAVLETSARLQLSMIGVITPQEVNVKSLPWRCCSDLISSLFRLIKSAEVFTLSFEAFKGISSIRKMKFPRNRCKRIVLHPNWNDEMCLQVIFKLLKRSINLEELIIYVGEASGNCRVFYPDLPTCVMPLLKTVTIQGNHGYEKWGEAQLLVIEYLLKKAVVLEKLVITLGENKEIPVEELYLFKRVSKFRRSRASTKATVIFV